MRSRSVRLRVTATATIIVAVAITAAAWALVRVVEDQLVDKVQAQGKAQVAKIAKQIESGVAPNAISPAFTPAGGFVQVVNQEGDVLGGTGTVGFGTAGTPAPTMFIARLPEAGTSGGLQVEVPAGIDAQIPVDVRYESISTPQGPVTVVAGSPLDGVTRSIATLKSTLIVGVPLLVALVALIAWLMVGRALRPVEAIRAEVESISESTMHRRVPSPGTGDEVDRLAHTMNAMLDRLETSATRQRRFVSDASHELRSPIAGIRSQLEVALQSNDDWPAVATTVLAEEQRLETLVDDLLLLASVDEEPPSSNGTTVSLTAVVREQASRPRRVPVEVSADSDASVGLRPNFADRLVANLLDNAARHARSLVRVTVTDLGTKVRLVVDDDGPGIPRADRARVFERFARLDDGRARDRGGAGLGLALVKAIVESSHGTVAIDDAPIGGARAVVVLGGAR